VTQALNSWSRVVLLCHDEDPIDRQGLARWLASSLRLVGIIAIRGGAKRRWRALRRQVRRSGMLGAMDALAWRLHYRLTQRDADYAWMRGEVARLARRYPPVRADVPTLHVSDPNGPDARAFLQRLQPDLMVARCKQLLAAETFTIPRHGTFVLHPGICPEYRNAHGCFWALAQRDLSRVGMTLLRIDRGVDTGPAFLHASYAFDERRESPIVIQYRVVTENLDAIGDTLRRVCAGQAPPLDITGHRSAVWGQPTLSSYWRWKRAAAHQKTASSLEGSVAP
jgi:hypothetical protein